MQRHFTTKKGTSTTVVKSKHGCDILTSKLHPVIVFLCTPRCGTQWLAKNLNEIYSNDASIRHEPLGNEYGLRVKKEQYDISESLPETPVLANHLDYIEEHAHQSSYIEVGWQSISWFPELYCKFGKNLRLIHLYRNPLNVAASLVTHNWYTGEVQDRSENGELTPFDDASTLNEYKSSWNNLNLFEKSLYYWTEVNLRALEIEKNHPELPFYSLKFEDLFNENKEMSRRILEGVLHFMGLNYNEKMLGAIDMRYDNYQYQTTKNINWKDVFKHPKTVKLAEALTYTFNEKIDLHRYRKRSLLQRFIKKNKLIITKQ